MEILRLWQDKKDLGIKNTKEDSHSLTRNNMKKVLEKLGIETFNDLVGTIGGIAILALIIELLVFIWVDSIYDLFLMKLWFTTILVIVICSLLND